VFEEVALTYLLIIGEMNEETVARIINSWTVSFQCWRALF
jgi:hypothetical protein